MKRPDCIRHWRELEGPDDATYPDSPERFSIGAPLGRGLRLNRQAAEKVIISGEGRSAAHYAPVVYLYAIVAPLFTRMLIYSP